MAFERYQKSAHKRKRTPGANEGTGGVPRDMGSKRCLVCEREYERKRYPGGSMERPHNFEARVVCSRRCACVLGRAARYGRRVLS